MFSSFIYLYNKLVSLQNFCSYFKQSNMSLAIDLESYKAEIISLFRDDNFSDSIVNTLVNKYNLWVAEHMIKSHLQQWEIHK